MSRGPAGALCLCLAVWLPAAGAPGPGLAGREQAGAISAPLAARHAEPGNPQTAAELRASQRFALDAIYRLLDGGQLRLARAQWQEVAALARKAPPPASSNQPPECALAEIAFVQGLLAAAASQREEALQSFQIADGCGFPSPASPQMVMAADALYALEEYQLAAQAYRVVLNSGADRKHARLRLAACLHSTGRLDAAVSELELLLRQSPDDPEANYGMGAVLLDLKREDDGRGYFERALAQDPRCYRCMAMLAYGAYLVGDDARCQAWLDKAIVLDPTAAQTNLVYGMLANRGGKYAVAVRHLARVVEQLPNHAQAQYQIALAYQRLGNAAKSKQHMDLYGQLMQARKGQAPGTRQ